MICASAKPSAKPSRITAISMRVSRMQGLPPQTSGREVILAISACSFVSVPFSLFPVCVANNGSRRAVLWEKEMLPDFNLASCDQGTIFSWPTEEAAATRFERRPGRRGPAARFEPSLARRPASFRPSRSRLRRLPMDIGDTNPCFPG